METALTRIEMAELKAKLAQTSSHLQGHPEQLKKSLEVVLNPYLKEVGQARSASDNLTQELRAAAVIDARIAESGWRGIGVALAAIFKHQNLRIAVGSFMAMGGVLGLAIAWELGESNRRLLDRNQQVIQACNQNWASDPHHQGWYTCPLWQLPMPEKQ